MTRKVKELTREEVKKWYSESSPDWEVKMRMRWYDQGIEFRKTHPSVLPNDMRQVNLTGYSNDTIDDVIRMNCDCGEEFTIAGGYITICPKCNKGYRVISYIAQYDKI